MNAIATLPWPENLTEPDDRNEAFQCADIAEARARLSAAIRISPGNGELPLALGDVEMNLENFEGALAAYASAARLLPKVAQVHSRSALACHKLGRSNEAARSAVQAVLLDPGDITALKVLARIHLDTWQHEAARKACRRILQRDAQDVDARQMLEEAIVQEAKLAENLADTPPLAAAVKH